MNTLSRRFTLKLSSFLALATCLASTLLLAADLAPKDVDANAAEKLIKEGKVVVLDVRTKDEFDDGHIAGAKNIDFRQPDFEKQLSSLDKSKSYLVHCQAGGRSKSSMKVFEKLGFQSIYHLNDGFMAWEDAGKPVQK